MSSSSDELYSDSEETAGESHPGQEEPVPVSAESSVGSVSQSPPSTLPGQEHESGDDDLMNSEEDNEDDEEEEEEEEGAEEEEEEKQPEESAPEVPKKVNKRLMKAEANPLYARLAGASKVGLKYWGGGWSVACNAMGAYKFADGSQLYPAEMIDSAAVTAAAKGLVGESARLLYFAAGKGGSDPEAYFIFAKGASEPCGVGLAIVMPTRYYRFVSRSDVTRRGAETAADACGPIPGDPPIEAVMAGLFPSRYTIVDSHQEGGARALAAIRKAAGMRGERPVLHDRERRCFTQFCTDPVWSKRDRSGNRADRADNFLTHWFCPKRRELVCDSRGRWVATSCEDATSMLRGLVRQSRSAVTAVDGREMAAALGPLAERYPHGGVQEEESKFPESVAPATHRPGFFEGLEERHPPPASLGRAAREAHAQVWNGSGMGTYERFLFYYLSGSCSKFAYVISAEDLSAVFRTAFTGCDKGVIQLLRKLGAAKTYKWARPDDEKTTYIEVFAEVGRCRHILASHLGTTVATLFCGLHGSVPGDVSDLMERFSTENVKKYTDPAIRRHNSAAAKKRIFVSLPFPESVLEAGGARGDAYDPRTMLIPTSVFLRNIKAVELSADELPNRRARKQQQQEGEEGASGAAAVRKRPRTSDPLMNGTSLSEIVPLVSIVDGTVRMPMFLIRKIMVVKVRELSCVTRNLKECVRCCKEIKASIAAALDSDGVDTSSRNAVVQIDVSYARHFCKVSTASKLVERLTEAISSCGREQVAIDTSMTMASRCVTILVDSHPLVKGVKMVIDADCEEHAFREVHSFVVHNSGAYVDPIRSSDTLLRKLFKVTSFETAKRAFLSDKEQAEDTEASSDEEDFMRPELEAGNLDGVCDYGEQGGDDDGEEEGGGAEEAQTRAPAKKHPGGAAGDGAESERKKRRKAARRASFITRAQVAVEDDSEADGEGGEEDEDDRSYHEDESSDDGEEEEEESGSESESGSDSEDGEGCEQDAR